MAAWNACSAPTLIPNTSDKMLLQSSTPANSGSLHRYRPRRLFLKRRRAELHRRPQRTAMQYVIQLIGVLRIGGVPGPTHVVDEGLRIAPGRHGATVSRRILY